MKPRRKKTGGRDFKKGQSGNPAGRPPLPPEIRDVRKANSEMATLAATKVLKLTFAGIQQLIADPAASALEVAMAAILGKAISLGDQWRFEAILCRAAGPVPKELDLKSDGRSLEEILAASWGKPEKPE